MMIRNLLALIGLAAIALVTTVALQAYGYFDEGLEGPPPRVAVSYIGLDLTTPEGIRMLEQRVNGAIREVCPRDSGRSLSDIARERRCRRRAIAMVEPQVAAAIARAETRIYARPAADRHLADDQAEADRMLPPYPVAAAPPAAAPAAAEIAPASLPTPARRLIRRTTTTVVTTTRTGPAAPAVVRKALPAVHRAAARPAAKRSWRRSTAYARRPEVPGSWLPPAAWHAIERANARAFATGRIVHWASPGRSGYVTVSAPRRIGGAHCRNLRVVKQADARQIVVAEGTRCRLADGQVVARDCP